VVIDLLARSGAKCRLLSYLVHEFGSKQSYKQFPPRSRRKGRGNRGWFIFIALERFQPVIVREWLQGYEKIANEWKGRAA
jgi:hypothetical protein